MMRSFETSLKRCRARHLGRLCLGGTALTSLVGVTVIMGAAPQAQTLGPGTISPVSSGSNGTAGSPGGSSQPGTNGGAAGSTDVTLANGTSISSSGNGVPALQLTSDGGGGGTGGDGTTSDSGGNPGGNGGGGGAGGRTTLDLGFNAKLQSAAAPAVVLGADGGAGGDGGQAGDDANGGQGGTGGAAGQVSFSANPVGLSVTSSQGGTTGFVATANGGNGGQTADSNGDVYTDAPDGAAGGSGGSVTLNFGAADGPAALLQAAGTVVAATAAGGQGSPGGVATTGLGKADGGDGGKAGNGGSVSVTLSNAGIQATPPAGSTSTIPGSGNSTVTIATPFAAVQATSAGGVGGAGGDASGGIDDNGKGGAAGSAGSVALTVSSSQVTAAGDTVLGLYASSTGGAGGAGAAYGSAFIDKGGSGGPGGNGSTVSLTANTGSTITTSGDDAAALLAQSIGGGGGKGGDANGGSAVLNIVIGGQGAQGGDGGSVSVTAGTPGSSEEPPTVLVTGGASSPAIQAQSIGGGGGVGGDASSLGAGAVASIAIGGKGGQGGDSGTGDPAATTVSVTNAAIIQTQGAHAPGIQAQSVGGGGGAGGGANAVDAGVQLTVSTAVGGQGGTGGVGSNVLVDNQQGIATEGTDAYGIQAQSIGGGGGSGGASLATALQLASDSDYPSVNLNVALGGNGGTGGDAGVVTVSNSQGVLTSGVNATGIIAQSIGGGGGDGGDAGAFNESFTSPSVSVTTTIGGKGKAAGAGGNVEVTNSGLVLTLGDLAAGMLAQSVGGGGGSGGYGNSSTGSFSGSDGSLQLTTTLGGSGGAGGDGGTVAINNNGGIITRGDVAPGLFAQSVGGGGGTGGGSVADGSGGSVNVNLAIAGSGGKGGAGNSIGVGNSGAILTTGGDSPAIFAQSVGGGGGSGGQAATGSGTDPEVAIADYLANGAGVSAGVVNAGNKVYAFKDNYIGDLGTLDKLKELLSGYEEQNDEAGAEDPDEDSSESETMLTLDVGGGFGGKGGAGGNGGGVGVTNSGDIETDGPASAAIFAQSVGGGGGSGGVSNAASSTTGSASTSTIAGALSVGGGGGSSGDGGLVDIASSGSITTLGDLSYGIEAHSIGGGGGKGGLSTSAAPTFTTSDSPSANFAIAIGGSNGADGDGGPVTVGGNDPDGGSMPPVTGFIQTSGDDAAGIFAQSVGGGGGLASLMTLAPTSDGSASQSQTGLLDAATTLPIQISGKGGSSGSGGAVGVTLGIAGNPNPSSDIQTAGRDAYGVLAQSIGGGGGLVVGQNNPVYAQYDANGNQPTGAPKNPPQLFGSGSQTGDGGPVTVSLNTSGIETSGDGAVGVLAQSVGGGGGLIGGMSDVDLTQPVLQAAKSRQDAQGGNVTVNLQARSAIFTSGQGAHGIVAQSVGGGGGILSQSDGVSLTGGYAFAGIGPYTKCGGKNQSPCTGNVEVNLSSGSFIEVMGDSAIGVVVQSQGNGINATTINVAKGSSIISAGSSDWAIFIDGSATGTGTENTINNYGTIDNGATLGGKNATGESISGQQTATINNYGTINGTIDLPNGSKVNNDGGILNPSKASLRAGSTINNAKTGVLNAGERINLSKGGRLINQGAVTIGGVGRAARTMLTGSYLQRRSGLLRVDVDRPGRASDRLKVSGDVRLAGTVEVNLLSSTRKPAVVLQAGGDFTMDESFALVGRDGTAITAKVTDEGALRVKPGPRPRVSGTNGKVARSEAVAVGVPDTVGRYLSRRSSGASDVLAAQPADDRLGLAVFPVGDAEALSEAEPTAAADPTRVGFDAAHAPDAREGGVGFTYGLGGGMTVGLAVTSRSGMPAWSSFDNADDAPASNGVSAYVRQRLGMIQLDTRFAYSRDRQDTADLDISGGSGNERGAFAGRALDLAQRIGVPVHGDGYTLTPWAQLGYQNRQVDGFDLDDGDQHYDGIQVGDTLASFGLDGRLEPIQLGEAAWLSLGGELSYTQGLIQDDYSLRVTSASGGQDRTIDRPTTQTLALGLTGSLALGKDLAIDGGLSIERDVAFGTAGSGRIGLSWHF